MQHIIKTRCGGGRFSKAFFLFTVSLALSVLVGSLALTFAPTSAYAEEQTGEATTEVYLVKDSSGTTPEQPGTTTTTITTSTAHGSGSSSTTKTGDTTPIIPLAIASVVAAFAITGVAIKKHNTSKAVAGKHASENSIGGVNL